MSRYSLVFMTIFLVIVAVSDVSAQDVQCTDSVQCSTNYCRDGQCINYGDDANDVGMDPCSRVRCAGYCVLQQVQCIQFPCPPVARCVPYKQSPDA